MKITKSQLKRIIKEELSNSLKEGDPDADFPLEEEPDDGTPEAVALMETLWDVVRGFYRLGRSDIALKLQKIAEIADEGHERLMPRGEGTPGLELPAASSQSAWALKNKLGIGNP